jgi:hypothetical protein
MAQPADYAKEAASVNEKNKVAMLLAIIIGMIVAQLPAQIIGRVFAGISLSLFFYTLPLLLALSAILTSVVQVSYVKMGMRVRKGETVNFMDILNVKDFLVPAAILGAPAAAVNLLGYLGLVAGIFGTLAQLLAALVMIALVWAPLEMALKGSGYQESWTASVNFWMKDPAGNLLFLILGAFVFPILHGMLIFAPGISIVSMIMYYTDKTGTEPFRPGAAPAPAAATAK